MPVDIGTSGKSTIANGLKGATPASSSGGWGDVLEWLVPAGASLAGGWLSGQAGEAAANADRDAAQANVQLSREVYNDQRNLARPGYLTGGAATNLLGAQFGIGPQNYEAAYAGGGSGGGGTSDGSVALPNFGAGQPVQGHSGGGGGNALTAGLGSAAGTFFGGPIGGAIGGAIGGLIRNGGDNWQTIATQAPGGFDYAGYMAAPDLQAEWAKPDVQSLFGGNQDAYANWHYNKFGKGEGRQLNSTAAPTSGTGTGGTGGTGGAGTGANALADPMAGFMSSPYGKIATSGFRGVDTPEINGAYARGGKVLSGAQSIALDERGKARLGGAYGDYTNGLRSLAGLNQTASSQVSSAAGTYGANAGNANTAAGQAKGNALSSAYGGIAQGISGALGGLQDFGKKKWGWE